MTALLRDVSHQDYHLDQIPGHPGPHFSRSVAMDLLADSALHAWHRHPRFGNHPRPHKESTEAGSLIHSLLLGTGPEIVIVRIHGNKNKIGPPRDAENFQTDEAKKIKAEALASGALPILAKDWEAVQVAASIIERRLETLGVPCRLGAGESIAEGVLLWEDRGVPCKCRPDIILAGVNSADVWDLKITGGGRQNRAPLNPAAWRGNMVRHGLDLQWHAATSAIGALRPDLAGRVNMRYVVCEAVPPYDAWIQPVGKTLQAHGADRWGRALLKWKAALEAQVWLGHGEQEPAEARPWELEQEFTAAVAAAGEPSWMED